MSELLSSITGGSASFNSKFASGMLNIAIGSSGDILVLTPPAGQRVKLNWLIVGQPATEAGITITVNGVNWITSLNLSDHTTGAGEFFIGNSVGTGTSAIMGGCIPPEIFPVGAEVAIKKDTGSTADGINYNYEFGA